MRRPPGRWGPGSRAALTEGGKAARGDTTTPPVRRSARSRPQGRRGAGVTFTDEPGSYIPGELGIRHEDTLAVTESGCENLAPKWSGTPEEPAVL